MFDFSSHLMHFPLFIMFLSYSSTCHSSNCLCTERSHKKSDYREPDAVYIYIKSSWWWTKYGSKHVEEYERNIMYKGKCIKLEYEIKYY